MMELRDLRRAIAEKLIIQCMYEGRTRIGEPHLIGDEGGDLTLEIFQIAGGSESRRIPDWRHFKLSGMSKIVVTEKTFTVRGGFNPDRPRWRSVLAHVLP